jgi:predicted permease
MRGDAGFLVSKVHERIGGYLMKRRVMLLVVMALLALALVAPAAIAQDDDDDGAATATASPTATATATSTATVDADDDDASGALPRTGGPALIAPIAGALLIGGGVAGCVALSRSRNDS